MPLPILGGTKVADTTFSVANSCRFNTGDSAYMEKSPASDGSNTTATFSAWVKRGNLGARQAIFGGQEGTDTNNRCVMEFNASDQLVMQTGNAGSFVNKVSNRLFRDHSAWYHLVFQFDTTNGTAASRWKFFVNGVQETSLATDDTFPDSADIKFFENTTSCRIAVGMKPEGSSNVQFFDGYMAEVVVIDGTVVAPSSFGEFDEDSPQIWKPKDVSGLTFGTNGFYLDFEDSSNLGNDANGGTDLTESNLDATDQATDTPTNNFATWNPLIDHYPTYSSTLSNGNLSTTRNDNGGSLATIMPSQGKWYMEAKCGTVAIYNRLGVVPYDKFTDNEFNPDNKGVSYQSDGDKVVDSSASAYGNTYTTGDIIGIALNLDDGEITFYKNGVAQNSGTSITGFTYDGANSLNVGGSGSTWSWDCNFGNAPYAITSGNADADGYGNFEYAVPSGYYALCTKNLAEYG